MKSLTWFYTPYFITHTVEFRRSVAKVNYIYLEYYGKIIIMRFFATGHRQSETGQSYTTYLSWSNVGKKY